MKIDKEIIKNYDLLSSYILFAQYFTFRLSEAYSNQQYCDCVFVIGTEKIYGMKMIMSLQSDYFKVMFRDNFVESGLAEIPIECNDVNGFNYMIRYMHGFEVELNQDLAISLYLLSDFYEVKVLTSICLEYMKERVNNDSCLSYYLFADNYHINELLDICIDFIQVNTKDFLINNLVDIPSNLLITILKFDYLSIPSESYLINIILDWYEKHNCQSEDNIVLYEFLNNLRWDTIPLKIIQNHTRLTHIVTKKWLNDLVNYKNGENDNFLVGYNKTGRRSTKSTGLMSSNSVSQVFKVLDVKNIFSSSIEMIDSVDCPEDSDVYLNRNSTTVYISENHQEIYVHTSDDYLFSLPTPFTVSNLPALFDQHRLYIVENPDQGLHFSYLNLVTMTYIDLKSLPEGIRILDKSSCCIQNNNIYYLSTSSDKQLLQYNVSENEWKEISLSTHFSNGELLSDPLNPNLLWITSRRTVVESKSGISLQLSIWKYDIKHNELTKIKNHKTPVNTDDDDDEKVIETSPFSMIFETICVIATNSHGEFYLFVPEDGKVEQLAWPKMDHLIMYDYDQNTIVYISSEGSCSGWMAVQLPMKEL